ncbi:MAG: zinc ABC transporter substrate-binding protein, partial [Thermoleophilia bacterium]|nr:zinc ABC transporter substrate-binding protein [Thermoleophilia bacterium]
PAPSTLAETNPAQLEELAEAAEQAGVRTIFSEAQHSDADVVALAERVGDIEVATLHTGSLGEPGSGAENYLGLLRTNAELIASGLS